MRKTVDNRTVLKKSVYAFVTIVIVLIIIGIIFIYSSSSVYALEKHHAAHYFVKKQLCGLIAGLIAFLCGRCIPATFFYKTAPLIFFTALGITTLSVIPYIGAHINGANRWIAINGFSFQPSELLKIGFILGLAYFLDKRKSYKLPTTVRYGALLCLLILPALILLAQPDFGYTVILLSTALILFFIAHIPLKILFCSLMALIPIAIGLIIHKPYRIKRVLTFLNPWDDPLGNGFQIIQSFIAIGSGGIWGVGFGASKQKFFYLPMQHTDFIFAIIAEETGFIGTSFIILLYLLLLFNGLRISAHLSTLFNTTVTAGFTIWISIQAIINLAVTTGLAPTKGVGLPFISYGNTALVTNLFMVGLITNIVSHENHSINSER